MVKIPGVVFTIIGIAVYIVTAFAPFEKAAKVLFTVIAALLIIYGIGSMAIAMSNKRRLAAEVKKSKFDYMPQASQVYTQQQMAQQQASRRQAPQYAAAQPQQRQPPKGAIGFCSVCGYTARSDDNFCGKCGSRLR